MLMLLSRVSSSSSLRLFHSSSSSQQRQVAWVSSSSSDHHRLRRLLQHRTHTVFVGSGKLAAEDFVPSPFVAYNFHHSSSIMTAGTNRRSMRLASSSSSNPSNPKNKEGSSTNKKVPVVAAKTKNQQKKNPMKEPSTTTKSKSSTVTIPSSPSKKDIPNDNHPWYRIFTKGDEEYDRYMATEWGFEKVCSKDLKLSQQSTAPFMVPFWETRIGFLLYHFYPKKKNSFFLSAWNGTLV